MRCKGSVKGMKHKINFVLFSNLLPFDEVVHFSQRRTPLKNKFISFIKKKSLEVLVVKEKVLTLHSQFGNELLSYWDMV